MGYIDPLQLLLLFVPLPTNNISSAVCDPYQGIYPVIVLPDVKIIKCSNCMCLETTVVSNNMIQLEPASEPSL